MTPTRRRALIAFKRRMAERWRTDPKAMLARAKAGGRAKAAQARRTRDELRDWLAKALGLETRQVTVFHRQGAGAYGHNTADDCAFDASYLAMKVPGRTVPWTCHRPGVGAGGGPFLRLGTGPCAVVS